MKSFVEKHLEERRENRILFEREKAALEVSEKIYLALEESGMTRAEFAKKMGKSKAYVTRLLGGNYNLTLGTIAEVAYHLDCEVEVFFRLKTPAASKKILKLTQSGGKKPPKAARR